MDTMTHKMIDVETHALTGRALDWAVAIAEGWQPDRPQDGQLKKNGIIALAGHHKPDGTQRYSFSPSTSWICGGPLLSKHLIEFTIEHRNTICAGLCDDNGLMIGGYQYGDTHLIAAMRAVVAHALGDTVSVPAALLEVA